MEKTNQDNNFPVARAEAEWQARLDPQAYHILREQGTEPAFSSPLYSEKRDGAYLCAACENALFDSAHKFESGTGWPSFWQPAAPGAVETSTDYKIGYERTEVHCARCGGHLGHIFGDGPAPTGLRYCINGAALTFTPRPD